MTNIGDYRRRTLSRCNSSLNYGNALAQLQQQHQQQQSASSQQQQSSSSSSGNHSKLTHQPSSLDSGGGDSLNRSITNSNLLQIPNPNYLQIPRLSRASLRNQSLRRNSRRLSRMRMLSVESGGNNEDILAAVACNGMNSLHLPIPASPTTSSFKTMHENLMESCITEAESVTSK